MKKHPFIVIESLDAAGGSTQVARLKNHFKRAGVTSHTAHFPQADEPTGQLIYQKFLLTKKKHGFSRREQALLYIQDFFAGAYKLQDVLEQKRGKHILILDRYYTSTMAYQTIAMSGKARKAMLDWIEWLCAEDKPALPKPDVVVLLDLPVEHSLLRLKERREADYFENEKKLTQIRQSYLRLAKEKGWTIVPGVDENGDPRSRQAVHKAVWQAVEHLVR